MADINVIQRGELQARLVKGLLIEGERAPAPVLAPEMIPVVIVEDLTRLHAIERRFGAAVTAPAVAGALSLVTLSNPANSGKVITLDAFGVSPIAAAGGSSFKVGEATAAGATGAQETNYILDTNATKAVGVLAFGSNAATDIAAALIRFGTGGVSSGAPQMIFTPRITLNPGFIVSIECQTVNTAFDAWMQWSEENQR